MITLQAILSSINGFFNVTTMTWVVVVVGTWQLLLAVRFLIKLRKESSAAESVYAPPVSVVISCKGASRHFERNMLSFLAQKYHGHYELIFVSPRTTDPAYLELQALLPGHPGVPWKLLSSEAVPVRCCEKAMNMLFALERATAETEVFVFADCDIRVPENWLRSLVCRLGNPDTIAVTNPPVYVAHAAGMAQFFRMVWTSLLISYSATFPQVFCPAWAIRRKDFETLGVAALWLRSAIDDLVVNGVLKKTGKRIELELKSIPVCWEDCDLGSVFAWFTKGFRWCRVYAFRVWVLGALGILGKLYLWFWFLRMEQYPLLSLMVVVDMFALYLVFETYRRYAPQSVCSIAPSFIHYSLRAGLIAPLIPFLQLPCLLNSMWSRELHWSGYTYYMHGPQKVDVRTINSGDSV